MTHASGGETGGPMPPGIDAESMAGLRAAGEAEPLLPEYEIGPVWHADAWWYVPNSAADTNTYFRADERLAGQFEQMREQLAGSLALAQEQAARRADQESR